MRTIKFRGQKISNGVWVYGSLVSSDALNTAIYYQVGNGSVKQMEWVYVNPDTVGQFTGLYDKNGEEIYEGDVVKFANPKYGGELFRIGYEDSHIGAFCLCEAGKEDTSRFVAIFGRFDYPFYCEVIGNIHDNPELLEGCEHESV